MVSQQSLLHQLNGDAGIPYKKGSKRMCSWEKNYMVIHQDRQQQGRVAVILQLERRLQAEGGGGGRPVLKCRPSWCVAPGRERGG